jgi:hypothetical protein
MKTREPELLAPRRLVDGDDEIARLLERGNREFEVSPRETEIFCGAQPPQPPNYGFWASLGRSRRHRGPILAFATIAGVAALVYVGQRKPNDEIAIRPEPARERRLPAAKAPNLERGAGNELGGARPGSGMLAGEPRAALSSDPRTKGPAHQSNGAPALPRAESSSEVSQNLPAVLPDCLSLARGGKPRDAEACFLERAAGNALGAEMALYEVARLRRDVLANPAGALEALSTYQRRFPQGTLGREVSLSHVELLVEVGRQEEALRESDALLRSGLGSERALELHLLRGHVYRRKMKDLAAAAREYALAERAGGGSAAADAGYLAGVCQLELGDRAAARGSFERYLASGQSKHREEVRKKLEALSE